MVQDDASGIAPMSFPETAQEADRIQCNESTSIWPLSCLSPDAHYHIAIFANLFDKSLYILSAWRYIGRRLMCVGGRRPWFWLPTNREPGANPGRPRRCNRARTAEHSVLAIACPGRTGR